MSEDVDRLYDALASVVQSQMSNYKNAVLDSEGKVARVLT
jgi:hypothetical protein